MILRPGFCGGVVLALLVHSGGEFGTVDELDLVRELHSSCTPSDPRRFRSARCNHRVNLAQNCRGEGHRSDFVRILEAEFRCDFLFSLEDEKRYKCVSAERKRNRREKFASKFGSSCNRNVSLFQHLTRSRIQGCDFFAHYDT